MLYTFTGRGTRSLPFTFEIEVEADSQFAAEAAAREAFSDGDYVDTPSFNGDETETLVGFDTVVVPVVTPYVPARATATPVPAIYHRAGRGTYVAPTTLAPTVQAAAYTPVASANGTAGVAVARVETRANGYVPTRVRHTRG